MDVEKVRADFPILKRKVNGKRLVYLDNAATTQKPNVVLDALSDFYSNHNANIHRAVHQLSIEATEAYEKARSKAAAFIKCKSEEVIFTRGTTESINLVRFAWAEERMKKDDLVVLTKMEHHSNIVPWQLVAQKTHAKVKYVDLDEDGILNMDEFERAMNDSPKLVAFTHCSNVLGTINDAAMLVRKARKAGATTLVDAAQSVPHMPVDVSQIGCDFLAFSGHKMLGPTGIGVLYGRKALLEDMEPFQGGGDMIKEVHLTGAKWNDVPYKFEAGTTNFADAVGLGVAIDYLSSVGMQKVRDHEVELLKYATEETEKVGGLTIYGPRDAARRGGVLSFNVEGIHPHDMASILDEEGVAIRSGHHCAQPLMERLDVTATNRASFYLYNSYDDVDVLVGGLKKAKRMFEA
ncbi:MAG: cysteine desulfurase [Thaumarchaeota archaeon]|nr:cysteine desulfurase [Nitrososphaerota archaeon]